MVSRLTISLPVMHGNHITKTPRHSHLNARAAQRWPRGDPAVTPLPGQAHDLVQAVANLREKVVRHPLERMGFGPAHAPVE